MLQDIAAVQAAQADTTAARASVYGIPEPGPAPDVRDYDDPKQYVRDNAAWFEARFAYEDAQKAAEIETFRVTWPEAWKRAEEVQAAAVRYAALGLPVVKLAGLDEHGQCSCANPRWTTPPREHCQAPGKHPGRGYQAAATADPERVAELFAPSTKSIDSDAAPVPGVGMVLDADGFIEIDEDPRHGGDKTLRELEERLGALPRDFVVGTPRGGKHFVFIDPRRDDPSLYFKAGEIKEAQGIDLVTNGQATPLPPTITPAGEYTLVSGEAPAALPQAWIDYLRREPPAVRPAGERPAAQSGGASRKQLVYLQQALKDEAASLAAVTEGRNAALNTAACRMGSLAGALAEIGLADVLPAELAADHLIGASQDNGYVRKDGLAAAWGTFWSGWHGGLRTPRELPGWFCEPRPLPRAHRLSIQSPEGSPVTGKAGAADTSETPDGASLAQEHASSRERAQVKVGNRNPVDIADQVVAIVLAANEPPCLFRMGDAIVRCTDSGALEPYDADTWLLHVARLVDFFVPEPTEKDPDAVKIVNPPAHALRMVPKAILSELAVLDGVVHTPYLNDAGSLVSEDGYNPDSRLILRSRVTLPAIPDAPGQAELDRAVRFLTDEWLADFPLASETSRANVLGLLLTALGRAFFGLAPLHVVDASTAGSGKGLLVSTISLIVTGEPVSAMELPAEGEEQRKKITTALLAGNDLIMWDESHVISGRTLAMILTAETYSDRLLGGNKMLSVRNRFTQVALGNNVQVWGDMKRRVVPVRLEPHEEHPEYRETFRHPNLPQWVQEHRGELLAAALTIWRGWITAGRPKASRTMGSFERWAGAVGGALRTAGIDGFLDGTADWLNFSDPDEGGWGEHLARLRMIYEDRKFTAKDVAVLCERQQITLPHFKRDPDKSMAFVIGNMYRSVRGKWWGRYRLEPSRTLNSETGGRTWTVLVRETARNGRGPSEVSGVSAPQVTASPGAETCESGSEQVSGGRRASSCEAETPESPDAVTSAPLTNLASGNGRHHPVAGDQLLALLSNSREDSLTLLTDSEGE